MRSIRTFATLGIASIVLWRTARAARSQTVTPTETRVFRAFNDGSDELRCGVWTIMQFGSFAAIPLTALVVLKRRGWARAGVVAVAGLVAWIAGKLIKTVVKRGRPVEYLDDVSVRGAPQRGLGFPSGHASVATTLALTATSGGAPRAVAIVAAVATAAGRLYSGAHLPLDVMGGLALGAIVGVVASGARRRFGVI